MTEGSFFHLYLNIALWKETIRLSTAIYTHNYTFATRDR